MAQAVPRLWPGETVVILGNGPSLTTEDVTLCRGRARVIAIKDAILLAPWCDAFWCYVGMNPMQHALWDAGSSCPLKFAPEEPWIGAIGSAGYNAVVAAGVTLVEVSRESHGLSQEPSRVAHFNDSYGWSAINLAVHLGARRIILLGWDMLYSDDGRAQWYAEPQAPCSKSVREALGKSQVSDPITLAHYPHIVEPLRALGVDVVNASRRTALDVFPNVTLEEALSSGILNAI